jgi:hypothetical protein
LGRLRSGALQLHGAHSAGADGPRAPIGEPQSNGGSLRRLGANIGMGL